ncbi:MAG: hypothetical protein M3O88_00955 [Actinomycetota bacterium]|nr:hypothetical protein [Actinomycetota bacterium]
MLGLVILLGVIAASSAVAAFRPSTSAEHFTSEGIHLESDSSGHAMFEAPAMAPGQTVTSKTEISYTGDAPAEIHIYGTTTGMRFARSLQLEVSREGETLYRGTLARFPDSYEHAVVDPHTWRGSTSATYRFDVTLMDRTAPQGAGASQTFTWEARSL